MKCKKFDALGGKKGTEMNEKSPTKSEIIHQKKEEAITSIYNQDME